MENEKIRCRKCRSVLLSENKMSLLNAHGEDFLGTVDNDSGSTCPSLKEQTCLYLSEESFPDFILKAVEESSWMKGKIYCPTCQARIGSFNFVSGSQCACSSHVLPQVHILRSKIDWMKTSEVHLRPVSFPNSSVVLCASTLPLNELTQNRQNNSEGMEGVGPTECRSNTDHNAAASTSQTISFRSWKKNEVAILERPECKLRHRQTGRKRFSSCTAVPHHESHEGASAKSSCFKVLDDELIATEDDSSVEDDEEERSIPDSLVCPVCLDVLYSPLVTKPCGHIFCEPCLRRMAQPDPTHTQCPLCRQIIGQCMPCPELAHDVRNSFSNLYLRRRQFELQHNSQHLPLPWTRNFRLMNAYRSGENWLERAGGWRTIVIVMSLNILGVGLILYLGKAAKIQATLSIM